MRNHPLVVAALTAVILFAGLILVGATQPGSGQDGGVEASEETDRLAIVWTSGDPDVAHRMALMYASGAQSREWFSEVRLIIWGPSQRLAVADKDIRDKIEDLIEAGVTVEACLACADSYGLAEDLRTISGLDVKYMGKPLSDFLKRDDWSVITF